MLRIASESGTTDIVATPHANNEFPYDSAAIQDKFAQLKEAAGDLIGVHLGSDFHIMYENVHDALANPTKYTINRGPYLMVELPELLNFPVVREILTRLQGVGIVPIITHPERHMHLQGHSDELKRWVGEGCLLQVTGQSLLGRFGNTAQKLAAQLLRDDLVHFIASDAHDTKDRTPKLDEAYHWVESRYNTRRAEQLFRLNPEAVLTGQSIDIVFDYAQGYGASRKWWKFW